MSNYLMFCKDCVYSAMGAFDYECLRYPPKFVDGLVDRFPLVTPLSRCGEFKRKEQEHVKKDKTESEA